MEFFFSQDSYSGAAFAVSDALGDAIIEGTLSETQIDLSKVRRHGSEGHHRKRFAD